MEKDEILESLKQKLISSLLKWEHKVDWLCIKDITLKYPDSNYFKVRFKIKSNCLDIIVVSNFHHIRGFKKDDVVLDTQSAGDVLFNLTATATASATLEDILADANRETIMERFIYKKYLEES